MLGAALSLQALRFDNPGQATKHPILDAVAPLDTTAGPAQEGTSSSGASRMSSASLSSSTPDITQPGGAATPPRSLPAASHHQQQHEPPLPQASMANHRNGSESLASDTAEEAAIGSMPAATHTTGSVTATLPCQTCADGNQQDAQVPAARIEEAPIPGSTPTVLEQPVKLLGNNLAHEDLQGSDIGEASPLGQFSTVKQEAVEPVVQQQNGHLQEAQQEPEQEEEQMLPAEAGTPDMDAPGQCMEVFIESETDKGCQVCLPVPDDYPRLLARLATAFKDMDAWGVDASMSARMARKRSAESMMGAPIDAPLDPMQILAMAAAEQPCDPVPTHMGSPGQPMVWSQAQLPLGNGSGAVLALPHRVMSHTSLASMDTSALRGSNPGNLRLVDDQGEDEEGRALMGAGDDGTGLTSGNFPGKRPRLAWTPELHAKFVQVVDVLGPYTAVPKTILNMMGVKGLTREQVASHLQKYRLHLKRQGHNPPGPGEGRMGRATTPPVSMGARGSPMPLAKRLSPMINTDAHGVVMAYSQGHGMEAPMEATMQPPSGGAQLAATSLMARQGAQQIMLHKPSAPTAVGVLRQATARTMEQTATGSAGAAQPSNSQGQVAGLKVAPQTRVVHAAPVQLNADAVKRAASLVKGMLAAKQEGRGGDETGTQETMHNTSNGGWTASPTSPVQTVVRAGQQEQDLSAGVATREQAAQVLGGVKTESQAPRQSHNGTMGEPAVSQQGGRAASQVTGNVPADASPAATAVTTSGMQVVQLAAPGSGGGAADPQVEAMQAWAAQQGYRLVMAVPSSNGGHVLQSAPHVSSSGAGSSAAGNTAAAGPIYATSAGQAGTVYGAAPMPMTVMMGGQQQLIQVQGYPGGQPMYTTMLPQMQAMQGQQLMMASRPATAMYMVHNPMGHMQVVQSPGQAQVMPATAMVMGQPGMQMQVAMPAPDAAMQH